MKSILVNKSIAYAAKVGGGTIAGINELNLLDTGAIAVFTENNVLVTAAGVVAALQDVKKFYMAVGNQLAASQSGTILSPMTPRIGTAVVKKAYTAPVKQVSFVGNDGTIGALNPPTLVAGQDVLMKIIDTTPGLRTIGAVTSQEIFRYSSVVLAGDTINTIITRMIATINADTNRIVNAVVVGSQVGIQLTAINFNTSFAIALDGILIGATTEQPTSTLPGSSVKVNYGEGTSDQIAALEDLYSVERGNTNRLWLANSYYTPNSLVVNGSTYDTWTFSYNDNRSTALGNQSTFRFETVVALPVGATQAANFQTIMTEMFTGLAGTSPSEIGQ